MLAKNRHLTARQNVLILTDSSDRKCVVSGRLGQTFQTNNGNDASMADTLIDLSKNVGQVFPK